MSKRVDICDLCDARYPEYKFKYKASRWFCIFFDITKETYDICDKCWDSIAKKAKQKK